MKCQLIGFLVCCVSGFWGCSGGEGQGGLESSDRGLSNGTSAGADGDVQIDSAIGQEQPRAECGGSIDRNLANLAAAAAEELGRWEIVKDLQVSSDGFTLELSPEGRTRCSNDCQYLNGVLALQQPASLSGDNNPDELAAAFVAGWALQKSQEATKPALLEHQLTRIATEAAECGSMFWFEAEAADCSGDCRYAEPEALSSKLAFAGYPDNPYLEFESALDFQGRRTSVVGIDPTYGLNEDGSTCAGTCTVGCAMQSGTPPGQCEWCCSCQGTITTWKRASWNANTYVCTVNPI